VIETRYKPWGEVRFTTEDLTLPTRYTYTGQYSYISDSATELAASASFGLMFYNARWYDPMIGRFAQADSIVPGGVQGLDRYAYVNNSPVNYVDPSGHFTEEAIWNHVFEECDGDYACATDLYGTWKADKDWWDKLMEAQPGDTLFGSIKGDCPGGLCGTFAATFQGSGTGDDASLTGVSVDSTSGVSMNPSDRSSISLVDIQAGKMLTNDTGKVNFTFNWIGFFRQDGNGKPVFFLRPGYVLRSAQTPKGESGLLKTMIDFFILGGLHPLVGAGAALADNTKGWGPGSLGVDLLDMETGDVQVTIMGPEDCAYLNFNCPTCFLDSRITPQYFLEPK
jgi:RHS repeat-associated protein